MDSDSNLYSCGLCHNEVDDGDGQQDQRAQSSKLRFSSMDQLKEHMLKKHMSKMEAKVMYSISKRT